MSILGKEKYLEEQVLPNIGHFQEVVFVCHLESSVPKPFVHQCLPWSTKMNATSPQTFSFSGWFLTKFLKIIKPKGDISPQGSSRYPHFIRFALYRTAALFMSLYDVFLLETCCAIQIHELLIGVLPRHLTKRKIIFGSCFVQCHNKFDFYFLLSLDKAWLR